MIEIEWPDDVVEIKAMAGLEWKRGSFMSCGDRSLMVHHYRGTVEVDLCVVRIRDGAYSARLDISCDSDEISLTVGRFPTDEMAAEAAIRMASKVSEAFAMLAGRVAS